MSTTRQIYLETAGVGAFGSALFFVLMMITLQTIQQEQKPRCPRSLTTIAGTAAGLVTAVVADCLLEERFVESNVEDSAKDLLMGVMALAIMGNFSLGGFNLETIFRLGYSGAKAVLSSSCVTFFKAISKNKNLVDVTASAIELANTVSGLHPATAQLVRDANSQLTTAVIEEVTEKKVVIKTERDTSADTGEYVPPLVTDVRP